MYAIRNKKTGKWLNRGDNYVLIKGWGSIIFSENRKDLEYDIENIREFPPKYPEYIDHNDLEIVELKEVE